MRGDRASSFARSRPRARPFARSRAFAVEGVAVESITGRRRVRRSRAVAPGDGMPRGIVEYLAVCVNSDGGGGGGSRISNRPRGPWGEGHGVGWCVRETCVHHTYIDPKVSITCKVNNLFVKFNDGS